MNTVTTTAPGALLPPLTGISSMATRLLLADLSAAYHQHTGGEIRFESVGGVDAARRVQAGEAFDIVALADDALARLTASGHVRAESTRALARSPVAIAVGEGAFRPDIATGDALKAALLAAESIGYSTGPSGNQLLKLLERWGIAGALAGRIIQAPAGVPVGQLVAEGKAQLGFQQLSELMHLKGITLLGPMPPDCEIVTTFSAGICAASRAPDAAAALIDYLVSPATDQAKRRQGMTPA